MQPSIRRSTLAGQTAVLLFLLLLPGFRLPAQTATRTEKPLTIGILGLPEETAAIAAAIDRPRATEENGVHFISGLLKDSRVVLGQIGYGKVNAAAGAALLINRLGVDAVISTGTAGALNPDYNQGDVVIGTDSIQHDFGQVTTNGFVSWQAVGALDGMKNPKWFPASEPLLTTAREAGEKIHLRKADTSPGARDPKTFQGIIVTGDSFISDPVKSAQLRERYGGDAVEMEGAAIAQVCFQAGIPFLNIRSLTDRADGGAFLQYAKFVSLASDNAAALVAEMLPHLKRDDFIYNQAPTTRQTWVLCADVAFGDNSPYAKEYFDLHQMAYQDAETVTVTVFQAVAALAMQMVPAKQLGVELQPGASGVGPVFPSIRLSIEATRQQAVEVAAIIGYLAQQSGVIGWSDRGCPNRRAVLLENLAADGWSDRAGLQTHWPELAKLAPNAALGFSRVKTPSSDGLLIIDIDGNWTRGDWVKAVRQLEDTGATLALKLRATPSGLAYIQAGNSWKASPNGESYLAFLERMIPGASDQLRAQSAQVIAPIVRTALKPWMTSAVKH